MCAESQNPKVLIGDDSVILNNLLRDLFEDHGFDVVQAFDGPECKSAFVQEKPDIAFIDLNMPQLDGINVLRFIKSRNPETVVVIMTGGGSEEIAVTAMKLKADDYLTKPFDTNAVVGTAFNLLERRAEKRENVKLRKRIRRSEKYLAHLTEIINEALITTDPHGKIELVNTAGLSMWGYELHELKNKDVHFLVRGESRTLLQRDIVNETLKKGTVEGEFHFRKKNKGTFPGYLSTSVIKDHNRTRGIVMVVADLTKLREVEDRLRQSEKLASLGRVVEGVAHEVRNSLTSLGGFTTRLSKAVEGDLRFESYTKIIREEVDRLEEMVRQIEDYVQFSRFYKYDFQKLDVIPLIEKARQRVLDHLPESIVESVKYTLQAPSKPPRFAGDSDAIEEILFNLILNAYEAMPKGGKLTITVRDLTSAVAVSIRDTGVGIPSEDVSDIFNPFVTAKMSGAGMGLSKVSLLVEEHRGRVKLKSEPGKGTTFEVLFPVDRLSNGAIFGEALYRSGPIP
jgi:PAS domain S-box-containing protein